ncbi:hypothetical protein ACF09H_21020 [Streptomyces sp. NPDC014983]|uniref:hypothetical protein n=1 Tax=Streptomyces sp. NPDC014983 TaxID=3364933 RepID=UPI003700D9DA
MVDSRERGDVLESPGGPDGFGNGLSWVDCPGCGTRAHIEAPVLVLRAGAVVPSLFATSVAELRQDATASAAALVEEARLAGAFTGGRFGGNVVALPRRLLPFALSRDVERDLADPEAACAQLTSYGAPTVDNYRVFLANVAAELADNGVGELLYAVTMTMPDRLADLVRAHPRLTDGTLVRDAAAEELREAAGTPLEAPLRLRQRLLEDLCGGRVPVGTAVERYAASLAAFGEGLRARLHAMYDQVRVARDPETIPLAREALELAGQVGETAMETELAARLGRLLAETLHTAHPADPAEAVRVLRLALDRLPEGSLQRAEVAANLASVQHSRGDGDRVERWEAARDLLARAAAVVDRRAHREFWARVQTNYGLVLGERPGGGPDDLTLGIAHIRAGLDERSPGRNRVDWSFSLLNLGLLLFRRGGPDDLRQAERCYRDALGRLRPDDDPVLWSQLQCNLADLLLRSERDAFDPRGARAAANAVVAFDAAHPGLLDTSRAVWLLAHAADLLDGPGSAEGVRLRRSALAAVPPRVSPFLHLSIARETVGVLADAGDWDGAADVAADMLTAVHALYDAQVTAAARRSVLLTTRGTARQAAFLLARAGRPERAVEAIERGLARELSVLTGRDTVDLEALERVDPLMTRRYREARERYRLVVGEVEGVAGDSGGGVGGSAGAGVDPARAGVPAKGPDALPGAGGTPRGGPGGSAETGAAPGGRADAPTGTGATRDGEANATTGTGAVLGAGFNARTGAGGATGGGFDVPRGTGATPGEGLDAPTGTGATPGQRLDAPRETGPTPGQGLNTPTGTGPTPGERLNTPTGTGPTPGEKLNTPTGTGPTPGQRLNTPTGTGPTPGQRLDAPTGTGALPWGGLHASAGAQAAAEREVRAVVEEIRAIPGFEGFLRTTEAADVVRAARGMPLAYLVNSPWGSCVLVVPRDPQAGVRAVLVPEVTRPRPLVRTPAPRIGPSRSAGRPVLEEPDGRHAAAQPKLSSQGWQGHWHGFVWIGAPQRYAREGDRRPAHAVQPAPGADHADRYREAAGEFVGGGLPPLMSGHWLMKRGQLARERTWTDVGDAVAWLKRHYTGNPPYERPDGARTYVELDAKVGYAVDVLPRGVDVSWVHYTPSRTLLSASVVCCPNLFHPAPACPLPPS